MPLVTRPGQTWEYILERDRVPEGATPEEAERVLRHQTRWHLAGISAADRAGLEDELGTIDPATKRWRMNTGTNTLTILRLGLRGADNLNVLDEAGTVKPVEFKTRSMVVLGKNRQGVPTDGFLDHIDVQDRRELANAITEGQQLTTDEKKG